MNSQAERVPQSTDGTLEPVGPSPFVKIVMRPMTKMLNPLIIKLAGRRHFGMSADARAEPTPPRSVPGAAVT